MAPDEPLALRFRLRRPMSACDVIVSIDLGMLTATPLSLPAPPSGAVPRGVRKGEADKGWAGGGWSTCSLSVVNQLRGRRCMGGPCAAADAPCQNGPRVAFLALGRAMLTLC